MKASKATLGAMIAAALLLGACASEGDDGDVNTVTPGNTAYAPPTAGADAPAAGAGGGIANAPGMAGTGGFGAAGGAGTLDAGMTDPGAMVPPDAGADMPDAGEDAASNLPPTAVAELTGVDGQSVGGVATFTQSGMDVALVVTLADCANGVYPLHIHAGTSCADEASRGEHWDGVRGEGIPAIVCDGGTGIQTHARMAGVAEAKWSIATGAADDIVGRVVVLHGESGVVACGAIVM